MKEIQFIVWNMHKNSNEEESTLRIYLGVRSEPQVVISFQPYVKQNTVKYSLFTLKRGGGESLIVKYLSLTQYPAFLSNVKP